MIPVNDLIRAQPLTISADNKTRLQIPALVRKMIKVGPNTKFSMIVTENNELVFSKMEK